VPDKRTHLRQAAHNEALIEFLDGTVYPDWIATITFYTGLHYVQAYLLSKKPPENPQKHADRAAAIDSDPFLDDIRDDYRELYDVSIAARYYGVKPSNDELRKEVAPALAKIKRHLRQFIT
jgi:hypothetical protein